MPASREEQQGPTTRTLQSQTGLHLHPDGRMAQDLPRYGKRLVRDKDTVGRRASPRPHHLGQTPPDHFAGLVGYYPDQDCHAVRCRGRQRDRPSGGRQQRRGDHPIRDRHQTPQK